VADHPSGSKGRRGNHQRGRSHFGTNAPWDGVGGTRNRRSVWSASVKAPRGAHHATFPPDLVEPCIRASTSAKGACPRCGAPWARVVMARGARTNGSPEGHWKPTCACPSAAPVPCVVLDPFAGTGSALDCLRSIPRVQARPGRRRRGLTPFQGSQAGVQLL
jgi:hypothetical protein